MAHHGCVNLWPSRHYQVGVSKIVKNNWPSAEMRSRLIPHAGAARGLLKLCRPTRSAAHVTTFSSEELIVLLIAYYVAFMIAGDLAAYAISLITELEFGGHVSLIVFLALYFLFL